MLTFDLERFIDTHFLAKESADLARLNRQLKGAIAEHKIAVAQLEARAGELQHQIVAAEQHHQNILAEIATAETHLHRAKVAGAEVARLGIEAKARATVATQLSADIDRLKAELQGLTGDLERAEKKHQSALARLKAELEQAKAEHGAELETLESQRVQRIKAIDLEIQSAENALADVIERQQAIQRDMIEAAEREIELSRRQFANENQSAILELEANRVAVHKELTMAQETVIEKYRPTIEGPLRAEIEALEVELGRLSKKLNAKESKVGFEWTTEQIEALLVRTLEDGTRRPNHLRIAGESESGKSHFVNQLISQGLKHFGLECDYELYDPYPSDTRWAIPPTISDDSKAVLARLNHWKEVIEDQDAAKRERPLVLVCDEADEMIRQYKADFVECVKAVWKRGRHLNVILWLLGQNGNVKNLAPLDWSDLKNAGGIYLNQVCFDYLKNAMKGRAMNSLTGELEVIAEKHPYYALVHPKGKSRPYPVAVPKVLFPNTTTTTPPGATTPPAELPATEATTPALVCPKCGSDKVKKSGNLNGRQRIRCNSCKRQSYAD